jgi:hypothetical protein
MASKSRAAMTWRTGLETPWSHGARRAARWNTFGQTQKCEDPCDHVGRFDSGGDHQRTLRSGQWVVSISKAQGM